MYFPLKIRRANYKRTAGGDYYADYRVYYVEISEDCLHRCVYCDVLVKESGGEGMHLDHFKPQKYFPDLERNPNNLVLSCAKCNQLKSDWWPEATHTSNDGLHGFVDPFLNDFQKYFEVNKDGKIIGVQPPADYVINLLLLNRPSRLAIRRGRKIKDRVGQLLEEIQLGLDSLCHLPYETMKERLPVLSTALREARKTLDEIL